VELDRRRLLKYLLENEPPADRALRRESSSRSAAL
jgi:hypothetical protein